MTPWRSPSPSGRGAAQGAPEASRRHSMNTAAGPWTDRVDRADWDRITSQVNEHGCALTPQLMIPAECERISKLYDSHGRSEEHTSELQSHSDLVCRLLLETKKIISH